jgi:CheY-like chemotaxis protein
MSPKHQDSAPLSLFVIDDDTAVLDTFTSFFNRDPAIVLVTCTSPMEALDRLKSEHADAIFCDYSMPDMDGIEFLRELRSRGNNAYFIICTGRHLMRVAIDTLNNGGNYYLQKNVLMMDEMPRVIDLIRKHRHHGSSGPSATTPRPQTRAQPQPADTASRSLIDNQFVPLCGFDPNGRIRYANRFYIQEIGPETAGDEGFFSAIPLDERAEFSSHLATLSAQNPSAHLLHHIRPQGVHGWFRFRVGVYCPPDTHIRHYFPVLA